MHSGFECTLENRKEILVSDIATVIDPVRESTTIIVPVRKVTTIIVPVREIMVNNTLVSTIIKTYY